MRSRYVLVSESQKGKGYNRIGTIYNRGIDDENVLHIINEYVSKINNAPEIFEYGNFTSSVVYNNAQPVTNFDNLDFSKIMYICKSVCENVYGKRFPEDIYQVFFKTLRDMDVSGYVALLDDKEYEIYISSFGINGDYLGKIVDGYRTLPDLSFEAILYLIPCSKQFFLSSQKTKNIIESNFLMCLKEENQIDLMDPKKWSTSFDRIRPYGFMFIGMYMLDKIGIFSKANDEVGNNLLHHLYLHDYTKNDIKSILHSIKNTNEYRILCEEKNKIGVTPEYYYNLKNIDSDDIYFITTRSSFTELLHSTLDSNKIDSVSDAQDKVIRNKHEEKNNIIHNYVKYESTYGVYFSAYYGNMNDIKNKGFGTNRTICFNARDLLLTVVKEICADNISTENMIHANITWHYGIITEQSILLETCNPGDNDDIIIERINSFLIKLKKIAHTREYKNKYADKSKNNEVIIKWIIPTTISYGCILTTNTTLFQ